MFNKVKQSKMFIKAAILVAAVSVLVAAMTGCTKQSVTTDDFKALAESKNFIVQDATSQFSSYDYVKEVTVVAPQDLSYQIEFYVLSDSSYAQSFFENNKTNFENNKSGAYTDSSVSGKNYAVFKLTSNGKYMFLERVDETVVYVNTDAVNTAAIEDFMKELKY